MAEAGPLNGRNVDEHILAATAARGLNESVSFGRIEPLDSTSSYFKSPMLMLAHRTARNGPIRNVPT